MLYTLLITLWFASFNANIICSTSYKWDHKDVEPTKMLIAKIIKLEKL
jgi:hypothetical protein